MSKKLFTQSLGALTLAMAVGLTTPSQAETIYALTDTSTASLIAFESSNPATLLFDLPISGLTSDTLVGIDFRPSTGQLFGFGSETLYVLDVDSPGSSILATSHVGSATETVYDPSTKWGVDFNPVFDLLRVVNTEKSNGVYSPLSGAKVTTDTALTSPSDVVEIAYDRNEAGASQTTLYGIDATSDSLVTIGSVNGNPNSPGSGIIEEVGPLGIDIETSSALDATTDTLWAILRTVGVNQLHTVDPTSGTATFLGTIATSASILGMAVKPLPTDPPTTPTVILPLTLPKAKVKLNFAKSLKDSVKLSGVLQIPANFDVLGTSVTVDFGGVVKTFLLDDKGKAKVGDDTFKIKIKDKNGLVAGQDAKYKVGFKKGDFADDLDDEGMINADLDSVPVSVVITINFGNLTFQRTHAMLYKAKAGKSGKAK